VSFPEQDLGLIGAVGRMYRRLRAERGSDELNDTQFTVLAMVTREGPRTPSELGTFAGVTPPSMHQAIGCLVDAGLVVREPDPHDGRKVLVVPTATGEQFADEVRRRRHEWLGARLDALSPEERQTLAAAARILRDIADS